MLDEGRCNDNSCAEVSRKEVDVDVDPQPADTGRDDGKEGGSRGDDEDDEKSRDASAETTVVLVCGLGDVADDVAHTGGV